MNDYRRQQIHAKALELLQNAGVTTLSVDPIKIAEHLEIDVHAKPDHIEGASGWLIKSGEHFGIAYATHISNEGFQRFSIAHELGHYWIDSHPEHIFKNSSMHQSHAGFGSADPIELEADYFAACLLMPATLCKRVIWGNKDGLAAVKALADTANTSLQASAIRYAELSKIPMAIALSHDGVVEYCFDSGLRKEIGWPRGLGRGSRIPANTATMQLASDVDAVLRADEGGDSAPASDWFYGVETKQTINEEAIGLGAYCRVLTLLTLDESDEEEDDEWDEPRFRK